MNSLRCKYMTLAVGFPILVVVVCGIFFDQFSDPVGWPAVAAGAALSAVPFVAVLVLLHRRREKLTDPVVLAGVRFAASVAFWYNVIIWLFPLLALVVRPGIAVNFIWLGLLVTALLYVYPSLLLLERLGRKRAMARSSEPPLDRGA